MRTRGAAVGAGILLTKLVGGALLAFSQTRLFQVYYFRMYLSLVVLGSVHGLLLLPVLLSLVGPPELPSVVVRAVPRAPSAPYVRPHCVTFFGCVAKRPRARDKGEPAVQVTQRPGFVISRSSRSEPDSSVSDTALNGTSF